MSFNAKKYEQLSAYLDGELSAAERADVERLLAKDSEARNCLDELRRISGMVSTLPRGRAPGNLVDAVMARVERESLIGEAAPESIARIGRWSRPFALAASLLIVTTVAIYTIPQFQKASQAPVLEMAEANREEGFKKLDAETETIARVETKIAAPESGRAVTNRGMADRPDTIALAEKKSSDMPVAPSATVSPAPNIASGQHGAGGGGTLRGSGHVTLKDQTTEMDVATKALPAQPKEVAYALGGLDSKVDAARAAPIGPPAEAEDGKLDSLIAANNARNVQIQHAEVESFDNQLRVEVDDPAMIARLGAIIETNLESQSAANLAKAPPEASVAANQSFWTSRDKATNSKQREGVSQHEGLAISAAAKDDELERVYVVNVPVEQAAPLLTSMQNLVESNQTVALWTANRMPVAQSRLAEEAMGKFNSSCENHKVTLDDGSCSNITVGAAKAPVASAGGEMKDDGLVQKPKAEAVAAAEPMSIEGNKRQAGPPADDRRRDADEEAPEAPGKSGEKRDLGNTSVGFSGTPSTSNSTAQPMGVNAMGRPATQPAYKSANAGYITMAISLRSNPLLKSLRNQSQSNSPNPGFTSGTNATQPAAINAPPSPTSQPTPTTQGVRRG